MFGMFRKKPDPAAVPPILPSTPPPLPPVLPKGPRQVHRAFTHINIPECFILGEHRARYIAGLFDSKLKDIMRQSWRQIAIEFGDDPMLAEQIEYSTFKNDPYLCSVWEFPAAHVAGEAILGMLVIGPLGEFKSVNWSTVPVRYFLAEKDTGPNTRLLEWSTNGYLPIGHGPRSGDSITVFADMVFDKVFGKKRPTAEQVAKRLFILKSVATYSQAVPFGKQLHALPDLNPAAKNDLHSIFGGMFGDTLRKENLWEDVSPSEKQLFESQVATLTQQQIIYASWRLEAVQVLMWALGLLKDLPSYDVRATPDIFKQTPIIAFPEFITSAKLREEKEIDQARDLAESWHWRSRTRELQVAGRPCPVNEAMKKAGVTSFEAIVRMSAKLAVERDDWPTSIGDDYPAMGKAYRNLTEDEWTIVKSITVERHFTLNWLCGYAPGNQWDNTPTET